MTENQLYIGDSLVDLKLNQVITITKKAIEIANMSARYVSHTNQITAAKTENNDRVFGLSSSERSQSTNPYVKLSCRLVQNGVETIKGFCRIMNFDEGYKITILEDMFDIFNSIDGKKLSDINPIATSQWDVSTMDSLRTATSGVVSAVLKWKDDSTIFDANYYLPCFYYHTIITEILEHTGLTLSGNILTNTDFTDLVIPFPGDSFAYDDSTPITDPGFFSKGTKAEDTDADVAPTYPASIAAGNYIFIMALNVQSPTVGVITNPAGYTTVSEETFAWGTAKLMYKVATGSESGTETLTRSGSTGLGTFFMAQMYRIVGTGLTLEDTDPNSATGNSTITWDAVTVGGTGRTLLGFVVNYNDGAGPGTPSGYTQVATDGSTLVSDMTLALKQKQAASSDGAVTASGSNAGWASWHISFYGTTPYMVNWNALWPDTDCKDLIKDFFVRFGIIPKEKFGTLYLKTIEEIITDRASAVDWSTKLVKTRPTINFDLPYAQNNNYDFEDSEFVDDPTLGRGVMTISNENLPFEKTVYTSVFENVREFNELGYKVALIDAYTGSTGIEDITEAPKLHLLTLKARTSETAITFWLTSRTDYKLAYFVDSTLTKDTGFQYFLDEHYPSFTLALQKYKMVTKMFNLSQMDVYLYDPHKLMYDGEGYYIINQITNFVPGKLTKVQLFKVG